MVIVQEITSEQNITLYIWVKNHFISDFFRSLDLTGPLLLGGVPNLPEDFPVHNRQFVGCMRNLSIDSKPIDMASYIANNGTLAGITSSRIKVENCCENYMHKELCFHRENVKRRNYWANFSSLLITLCIQVILI